MLSPPFYNLKSMCTEYFIQITLKSSQGIECVGKFNIGNDKETAAALFRKLQGRPDVNDTDVLYVEFMGIKNGLPYNLDVISCTLKELGENCQLIIKELFKLKSLSLTAK